MFTFQEKVCTGGFNASAVREEHEGVGVRRCFGGHGDGPPANKMYAQAQCVSVDCSFL